LYIYDHSFSSPAAIRPFYRLKTRENRKAAQDGSDEAPFEGQEDVAYAEQLWQALAETHLAGDQSILAVPYAGQHPHGAVLETLSYDKLKSARKTWPTTPTNI
jgi:hypothetical protein